MFVRFRTGLKRLAAVRIASPQTGIPVTRSEGCSSIARAGASRQRNAVSTLLVGLLLLTCTASLAQTATGLGERKTVLSGIAAGASDLAVDAFGNLFVLNTTAATVTEYTAASGYTTTVAVGSGFSAPAGIGLDAVGNVLRGGHGQQRSEEGDGSEQLRDRQHDWYGI